MTTYYVDTNADPGGDGTTSATTGAHCAWDTIADANAASFNPGDSILFNRGCTWREQLTVPSSGSAGSPITFGAYGSGAKPIINGSAVLASWTNVTTGTDYTADANCRGAWKFENAATDASGEGNTLTLVNTPTYVSTPTPNEGAYSLSVVRASSQYTNRTDGTLSANFPGKNGTTKTAFAVGGWYYFNSLVTNMSLVTKGTSGNITFHIYIANGATGTISVDAYLDSALRTITSTDIVATGAWYHIVARFNDGGNQKLELFINNSKQSGTYTATSTTIGTNNGGFLHSYYNGNYMDGYLDEQFAFDRALTDAEISDIYTYRLDGTGGGSPTNVWTANVALEHHSLYFNGTFGSHKAASGDLASNMDWNWTGGVLYAYSSGGDPSSVYSPVEAPVSTRSYGIYALKDYITVEGIQVEKTELTGIRIDGIGNVVQDCLIKDNRNHHGPDGYGYGIRMYAGSNFTVQQNTISNCNLNISVYTGSAAIDSVLIADNTSSNSMGDNIQIGSVSDRGLTNVIVEHNTISGAGFDSLWTYPIGIAFGGTGVSGSGNIVRYNNVSSSGNSTYQGYGVTIQGAATGVQIYYNVIHNNMGAGVVMTNAGSNSNFVYNNTLYNNASSTFATLGEITVGAACNSQTIKNNVIYSSATGYLIYFTSTTGHALDYNTYYGVKASPFYWGAAKAWATYLTDSGQDAHSYNTDPLFVNSAGGDFRLQSGSPCIDAGVDVGLTEDYAGNTVPQ